MRLLWVIAAAACTQLTQGRPTGIFQQEHVASAQISATRGVHPDRATLYYSSTTYKCDQGQRLLQINQVNDDYCDCEDGTDEPGTSACPQNSHGFFCSDARIPRTLPSSMVNDGVCDCCDGSDEILPTETSTTSASFSISSICPVSTCDAELQEHREKIARQAETHDIGASTSLLSRPIGGTQGALDAFAQYKERGRVRAENIKNFFFFAYQVPVPGISVYLKFKLTFFFFACFVYLPSFFYPFSPFFRYSTHVTLKQRRWS